MRLFFAFFMVLTPALSQDLRGHGGPVHALSYQNGILASGSFDQSVILWDLEKNKAISVLKQHEGAVSALIHHGENIISGGDDGRVISWQNGKMLKNHHLHQAKITTLALSPTGLLASASFDGTAVIYKNEPLIIKSKSEKLIGLSFNDDGTELLTVSDEGRLVIYNAHSGDIKQETHLKLPVTSVIFVKNTQLILGLSTGAIKIININAKEINFSQTPIISLSLSKDKSLLAAASVGGEVAVYTMDKFQKIYSLTGPGLPVWSLAFTKDELLTGGNDRVIRRWDIKTGEHKGAILTENTDPLKTFQGERGAELFRACAFCHGLTDDGITRAGPSLHKIVGRKVAGDKAYLYSESLKKDQSHWTKIMLMSLFEKGPLQTFPGTKMPEQRINNEEDRRLLIDFIERLSK